MVEPSSEHPTIPPGLAGAFRDAVRYYSDWRGEAELEVSLDLQPTLISAVRVSFHGPFDLIVTGITATVHDA
jgi:hypothetical protein